MSVLLFHLSFIICIRLFSHLYNFSFFRSSLLDLLSKHFVQHPKVQTDVASHMTFPLYFLTISFSLCFFLCFIDSQSFLFWKAYFSHTVRKGWRVRWRRDGRVEEEDQENYPSLSSVYSKHFTGNCCRRATDRRKGGQTNARAHTHKHHSLHLYGISWKSGLHHWIEKKKHKTPSEGSKVPLPFLSHGWHLSD